MEEPAGLEVQIDWRGRRSTAFVPKLLTDRDLTLDIETVARVSRAMVGVEYAAERMPASIRGLARLLLRSEGVASSYVEGILAPVVEVVLAEHHGAGGRTPGAWVAQNLAAATQALDSAHRDDLSVELVCAWHRTLMAGSPLPQRFVA